MRNALENYDDYLRGEGRGNVTPNWLPFRCRKVDNRVLLAIPPLDEELAQDFDVTQLIYDTLVLQVQVDQVVEADFERRFRAYIR